MNGKYWEVNEGVMDTRLMHIYKESVIWQYTAIQTLLFTTAVMAHFTNDEEQSP